MSDCFPRSHFPNYTGASCLLRCNGLCTFLAFLHLFAKCHSPRVFNGLTALIPNECPGLSLFSVATGWVSRCTSPDAVFKGLTARPGPQARDPADRPTAAELESYEIDSFRPNVVRLGHFSEHRMGHFSEHRLGHFSEHRAHSLPHRDCHELSGPARSSCFLSAHNGPRTRVVRDFMSSSSSSVFVSFRSARLVDHNALFQCTKL